MNGIYDESIDPQQEAEAAQEAEQQHGADELAEAERCGLRTGPGEYCDSPIAEGGSACGYHQRQEIRRQAVELERVQAEVLRQREELDRVHSALAHESDAHIAERARLRADLERLRQFQEAAMGLICNAHLGSVDNVTDGEASPGWAVAARAWIDAYPHGDNPWPGTGAHEHEAEA